MEYRSFSPKQRLAMTWWNRPGFEPLDGIICDGSVRAGKTLAMVLGFFLWSMACFHNQTFALCGRTVSALRRNIVSQLPQWLGGLMDIREHYTESRLTVGFDGRVNTFYLFGGQDESSCRAVQGITLAGALLDETALMPRSFVEQVCARCSVAGSKLWFNCNPEGPEHWFYREWICRSAEKRVLRLHFTMEDNPALDSAIRERYHRLYSGVFHERYILGRWVMAEGLVYGFDRQRHVTDELPKTGRYYISVDYGTRNPFSAGLWCVTADRAVRLREFCFCGRETGRLCTDEEYCLALERLAGDEDVEQVIVDPSAASLIAALRARGRFSVRRAVNDVLPGIRLVTALLRSGRLQVASGCANAIREFGLYRWGDDGELPRKEHDHAMDEIRYFCATVLRRAWRMDS